MSNLLSFPPISVRTKKLGERDYQFIVFVVRHGHPVEILTKVSGFRSRDIAMRKGRSWRKYWQEIRELSSKDL